MGAKEKKNLLSHTTDRFKFILFILSCIIIHCAIAIFSYCTRITPLLIFNIGSIIVYIICIFIFKRHPNLVFCIGYLEIILHSVVCMLLIGDDFGFSMYFITLVPMAYNLLYSTRTPKYVQKASLLTLISFCLYAGCYLISHNNEPVFTSDILRTTSPYVYLINMLIVFTGLTFFSILFLLETERAYDKISNRNRELDSLANKDPLTGLYNRRTMTDHVIKMYEEASDTRLPFSLIICDIDDFKAFNDTYGHDCGDEVLKTISEQLTALTRGHDFLCRWGGEEFLIFLKNIDTDMAKIIAERIRIQISKTDICYNNLTLHITMTFGVASSNETNNYEALFKLADNRLYQGKHQGKNQVV